MGKIYSLSAYRTNRLLEQINGQTDRVTRNVVNWQVRMSSVRESLNSCVDSLEIFETKLKAHRISCEKFGKRSQEFQKALECEDFDELVEFRRKIRKARRMR